MNHSGRPKQAQKSFATKKVKHPGINNSGTFRNKGARLFSYSVTVQWKTPGDEPFRDVLNKCASHHCGHGATAINSRDGPLRDIPNKCTSHRGYDITAKREHAQE